MPITWRNRLLAHLIPPGANFFPAAEFTNTIHFIEQTGQRTSTCTHHATHAHAHTALATHYATTRHAHRINFIDVSNACSILLREFASPADERNHLQYIHTPEHGAETRAFN